MTRAAGTIALIVVAVWLVVLGLAVLAGAGLVHGWVLYAQRKLLT